MEYDYLDKLPVSAEDREKLKSLAAPSPLALLSLIEAAPEAFESFIGGEKAKHVRDALEAALDESEKKLHETPIAHNFATGAIIDREPPQVSPTAFNREERDALFSELQNLKAVEDETPEIRQRIIDIETRLKEIFGESEQP